MIYCQKVGQLKHIRAVPPLKVGRLEPSHGDRFRRQWFKVIPKVIDFGTNRKRVCDVLLVRHSNFGPILHCFKNIAGFLSS